MAQRGWIKLYREYQEHEFWTKRRKFSKAEAWLDLLMRAQWQDSKILMGLTTITVKRGQLLTSQLKLSNRWKWSRRKTQVFLDFLRDEKMIATIITKRYTIVTVCNYKKYQDSVASDVTPNAQQSSIKVAHNKKNKKNKKRSKPGKAEIQEDLDKLKARYGEEEFNTVMAQAQNRRGARIRNIVNWARTVLRSRHEVAAKARHQSASQPYHRTGTGKVEGMKDLVGPEMDKIKEKLNK